MTIGGSNCYLLRSLLACLAGSLKGVGIPVKLLHEATGHVCTVRRRAEACSPGGAAPACHRRLRHCRLCFSCPTATDAPGCLQVELKNGEIYRGELHEVEDCWNVQLINVQATARDGKVRSLQEPPIRLH